MIGIVLIAADGSAITQIAENENSKYYDKYTSSNANTACNGNECLSHGLSETIEWYNDKHTMINNEQPWIGRGGHYSLPYVGIFYNAHIGYMGDAEGGGTFRLVATIR